VGRGGETSPLTNEKEKKLEPDSIYTCKKPGEKKFEGERKRRRFLCIDGRGKGERKEGRVLPPIQRKIVEVPRTEE